MAVFRWALVACHWPCMEWVPTLLDLYGFHWRWCSNFISRVFRSDSFRVSSQSKGRHLGLVGVTPVDGCDCPGSRCLFSTVDIVHRIHINLFMIDIPPSVYCSFPRHVLAFWALQQCIASQKCTLERVQCLQMCSTQYCYGRPGKSPWASSCPQTIAPPRLVALGQSCLHNKHNVDLLHLSLPLRQRLVSDDRKR